LIGTTISHYEVLERLGDGSFGPCYKARDLALERIVALAVLPARWVGGEAERRRLERELAAVAALDHANICPLHEVGPAEDGGLFVVYAFCAGEALAERIARGPLKLAVAVDLAVRIAAGLAQAHERGIVHGSLGAHCVMVAPDGQPKILDFGAHRLADKTCDGAGPLRVGCGCRAPEQLRGEPVDRRSDVWALGALLYEMLTGERPAALGVTPLVSALRPEAMELDPILGRALAPRPDDRFADAEGMRLALRSLHRSGSSPEVSAPPAVRTVGPYRILEHLGGGGMGIVYRAEHVRLGRVVALKLLPPELNRDPLAKARFLQEARTASALDHPNLCTIYDVGETEGLELYIAMPCYEGETLRERIERGPLPVADLVDIAGQIAAGLAKAHQKGIVHRDIKPANLMITTEGMVKILDFGIAKLTGQTALTREGSVVGTLAYMAPEQMRGEPVDARTDLWALGAVIYEMAAGRRAFPAEHDAAVRVAILHGEPEPLARLRPGTERLDAIVSRLLAKNPDNRPASAETVAADLLTLAGEARGGRRRWLSLAAVLALAGTAALGLYRGLPASSSGSAPVVVAAVSSSAAFSVRRSAVAMLGFRDLSGAAGTQWLGPALAEMLGTELATVSKVRVISGDNIARARRSLALPATDILDPVEQARLHNFLGADRVVIGSYLALPAQGGRRIRLDLRVLHLPEGTTEAALAEVGTEAELFDLVARTGSDLRRSLGLGGPSAEEEKAVRALRPASVEATRLYTQGLTRLRSFDPLGARELLQQAVRIDPGSAVLHVALSRAWADLGYDARAVEEARRASDLSASLPRAERMAITGRLYETEKSWEKAAEIYRSLWTFYPDDLEYGLELATNLMMADRGVETEATLVALQRLPEPAGGDLRIDLLRARNASRLSDVVTQKRAAEVAVTKARQSGQRLMAADGLMFEGDALRIMGRSDEAIRCFEEAKTTAAKGGFQWMVGTALANLGVALQDQGDLAGAEKANLESLAIAQQLGFSRGVAVQIYILGTIFRDRGEVTASLSYFERAYSGLSGVGDDEMQRNALNNIAAALAAQGELVGAQQKLTESLVASREAGNRFQKAEALHISGRIFEWQGEIAEAKRQEEAAFQLARAGGNPGRAATFLAASAELLARQGDLATADRRCRGALATQRRIGNRLGIGWLQGSLANLALIGGDLAAAKKMSDEQVRTGEETGARGLLAAGLRHRGLYRLAAGDLAGAREALGESFRESQALGALQDAMRARLDLAALALAEKRYAETLDQARTAAEWFKARRMLDSATEADSLAAEALLGLGRVTEAGPLREKVRAALQKSEDRILRRTLAPRRGRIDENGD
jgi:serine/threonine protein kinase/tetratricopeptide (TPR) repeat protein/TolB-like protein